MIYCRNLPIKYMLSMIVPVIFSLSAALLSLMGLRGKKHCTMRRLQSALFAIYSLLLLFVQIPLVVHLNEHSTIGGSSPFRYTDEQLWSLFNYISAVTALMSVVLFGAITLQFAAILMCHDKCRRDE